MNIANKKPVPVFNIVRFTGEYPQVPHIPGPSYLADYAKYRVTKEKDILQHEATVTILGASVASPGNITGVSAAAKAGKTAAMGVILAGAISKTGDIDGFPDLKVSPNRAGKAVIHFDTEQSEADQQYFVNTIIKRNGYTSTPDYFQSYNIRQIDLDNYQVLTSKICELCSDEFNGVHLIVIDGGADYIASVNDESSATRIVQYFIHLSIKYNCPVVIIVHQNPGSEKERGHFGSEIQRKCYGLLSITKNGDISTLQPKIMRKAGNGDIPLIHYQYSKDKGYHVQIDAPDKVALKNDKNRLKIEAIAKTVFAPPTSLRFNEARARIANHLGLGIESGKKYLETIIAWELVTKGTDDHYRLNMSKGKEG